MAGQTRNLALAFSLFLGGCAGATVAGTAPSATLVAYADAVETGNVERAYELSSSETRASMTLDAFREHMRENHDELVAEAHSLKARAAEAMRARAELHLRNGESVALALEDGEWVIEGGVLDAPALRTPRDAVVAFRQALVRRDFAGLMRVLNRQRRAQIAAEIARVAESTSDETDMQVEVNGDRATVHLTDGQIELVREGGEWHVVDVN
ncbi:MAG: hypothetical protein IPK60_14785 [Sandaracinaceae bacterium]|nr:hypothetical protein [Sandaracinaceae bacterium]